MLLHNKKLIYFKQLHKKSRKRRIKEKKRIEGKERKDKRKEGRKKKEWERGREKHRNLIHVVSSQENLKKYAEGIGWDE